MRSGKGNFISRHSVEFGKIIEQWNVEQYRVNDFNKTANTLSN